MWVTVGARGRPSTEVAAQVAIGLQLIDAEKIRPEIEFGFAPPRSLDLDLQRTFSDAHMLFALSFRLGGRTQLPIAVGLAYRSWRQQFIQLQSTVVPFLRTGMDVRVVRVRAFELGVRGAVRTDLVLSELIVPEVGKVSLFPAEIGIDLVVKKRLTSDPIGRRRTSRK